MTADLCASFESLVGQQFSLQVDEASSIQLELTACDATRSREMTGFSLTFLSAPNVPLAQGTYYMSTDGLDPMPIFLVPIGRRGSSVELQAIFAEPSKD